MATYSNIHFYDIDPFGVFSTTTGETANYTGPALATGTAAITDNEQGIEGLTLDDDNAGRETATADVTIGGLTSTGSNVDAERTWTLLDTVTGQTFQIIAFDVENGAASGMYLVSEIPLVAGRGYQTLAYDSNPNAAAGDPVLTYDDYFAAWGAGNGHVDGTGGDDLIDSIYTDADGEVIDGDDGTGPSGNEDIVYADDGNDTVLAGDGNDTIFGGAGDDSLSGGDGNDVIHGDTGAGPVVPTSEFLDWSAAGPDEANIEGGFTLNIGTMDVTMSWVDDGGSSATGASVERGDNTYVGGGEPFDPNSSLVLDGAGGANTSTTTVSFAAANGSGMTDDVENVSFRLNDVDSGTFVDTLTINAYDANGNPVTVTITPSGDETVLGNTVVGGPGNDTPASANGSVLIEIPGPVSYFEIIYENGGTGRQIVHVSDVHFNTVPLPVVGGDDTIDGGLGVDIMYGEMGNDTFIVAEGDVADGGDGDDTFNIIDLGEAGSSAIVITGGEGGETVGDTLNFGGQISDLSDITYTNADDASGGLSGFVTLNDGTVVTFSEIETLVICYAPGTLIETPDGPRAVEDLCPGDKVITKDRGPQTIRWVSRRDVPLDEVEPDAKPVLISAGALGKNLPNSDLIVSPQHRVLVGDGGQLPKHFPSPFLVPAKSLTALPGVRHMAGKRAIRWHQFACDRHELVVANGCQLESLLLGPMVVNGLTKRERMELSKIFRPDPRKAALNGPEARPCLKVGEVRRLLAARESRTRLAVA